MSLARVAGLTGRALNSARSIIAIGGGGAKARAWSTPNPPPPIPAPIRPRAIGRASTTTISLAAPTVRVAVMPARSRTASVSFRKAVRNPPDDTWTSYAPAVTAARRNCPAAFVFSVRVFALATSLTVTVAPGIAAPVSSTTDPAISAKPLKGPRSCSIWRSMAPPVGGPTTLRARIIT